MLIERKKTFVLITGEENTFSDFFNAFLKDQKKIEKENIVVQIPETIKATSEDFFSFVNIAEQKKQNGTSFVLINSTLNISDFPDYLNSPTIPFLNKQTRLAYFIPCEAYK